MLCGMKAADVRRINYGYVRRPPESTEAGQPLLVSGFAIRHPDGTILFDTGMSPVFDTMRDYYQPHRIPVLDALRTAQVDPADITAIVNCHMHWDHSGGNYELPGIPIYVQAAELEAARAPDFTLPEYTFDFPGARLTTIDGEHDLLPGIRIVSTPGHTPGHQSLLIETDEGVVMLAGQASDTVSAFSAQALALGTGTGTYPEWMRHLFEPDDWNVMRAYFAHDVLVWEPEDTDSGKPVVG